jgi:hypothetical protein
METKKKKTRARASKAGTGGIQQPGNASMPKQGETLTKTSERPELQKDPGTLVSKALTNIKIAIFKETYPEDKLNEDDQTYILEELGKVLRRTPTEEPPHLKSYRLEGGTLIYRCADQQSGHWLVKAIDNHRLGTGARLKVTDATNLPKPVKVALRTRNKVSQTQDELLTWINNLNAGLDTKHWKVLDMQSEPEGQRLILHIDRDSLSSYKEYQIQDLYRTLTGNFQSPERSRNTKRSCARYSILKVRL